MLVRKLHSKGTGVETLKCMLEK